MDAHELNLRVLAQTATVGMDSLARHNLSTMEWEQIGRHLADLNDRPIYVDDTPSQTVAHIRAHARKVARETNLGLVVVDYLQQIQVPTHLRKSQRYEQVGDISRSLKLLARELGVPVIAMAQVNRAAENRADKKPTMADLRESGAIEADADVVLLLHHADRDDPQLHCSVAKARGGRRADFTLAWQAHFARLGNLDPTPWGEPHGRKYPA